MKHPSAGRRLVQGPGVTVPISAPPALSRPRDGGLGPHSFIPSPPGTAAVQRAKPLCEPAPSPDTAAAFAIPGANSIPRPLAGPPKWGLALLRQAFTVAFPGGCMESLLLLENHLSLPLSIYLFFQFLKKTKTNHHLIWGGVGWGDFTDS